MEGFAALLETALSAGDVACLQLRLKTDTGEIDAEATRAVGAAITEMAQAYGDLRALLDKGRRVIRIHISGQDIETKIEKLAEVFEQL